MKKTFPILLFILVLFFASCGKSFPKIAKVDKYIININDFKTLLSPQNYEPLKKLPVQQQTLVGKQLITQAINNKILYILALKNGIKIKKDDEYNKFLEQWEKNRKDFYLKIGIPEKELDRIFRERYLEKLYLNKIKNSITYTQKDLEDFYNTYKKLYFTIKPYINGNEIEIDTKNLSIDEQNKLMDKVQKLIKKSKNNYETFKTLLKTNVNANVTFLENKKFNVNFFRLLFKSSPDEYKNILNLKKNSFSDVYSIENKFLVFYVINVQKDEQVEKFNDVKDKVIKYYIENQFSKLGQKKVEEYKASHKIEIYVDNPFALLK